MKQAYSPDDKDLVELVGIVVRDHRRVGEDRLGDPGRAGDRPRHVGRARLVDRRLHRDHHLVVVAVVTALDLDDLVPARRPLGDADGVHRRLRAGVGEAPHRQAVAVTEQLGDLGVELARRDEQRAVVELRLHGVADRRVHVAGEQGAEAHVVVDVLVAVDVDHPRAGGVADDDRMRVVGLEARGHAERKHLARPVGGSLRAGRAFGVAGQLTLGDRLGSGDQPRGDGHSVGRMGGGHRLSLPCAMRRRIGVRTLAPAL